MTATQVPVVWRPNDGQQPAPSHPGSSDIYRPDILETIERKIKELDPKLRELSLDIHAHPELAFEEFHAHDVHTSFIATQGFQVTKHFHLKSAWEARFERGTGGRTIGINSEMDALKGIGHACGHNLIGISGVAVACAIKAAMEKHDISGKIILLGTPAEEGGGGKVILLNNGAYKEMDICLMCHPAPGPVGSVSLTGSLAVQQILAEYKGHTAHAALSPWEGKNALDAAVLAYNNVSALRQQLKPTVRVHGIFEGKDWAVNIIPDHAIYKCLVRAPTKKELQDVIPRVVACFKAAALATGCEVTVTSPLGLAEIRQNRALGAEVANVVVNKYGAIDYEWGIKSASTDFGDITYGIYLTPRPWSMKGALTTAWSPALPSLHPGFAIPTVVDGGNHTRAFATSAATIEAHYATLDVSKALAATGMRVLTDDTFFEEVRKTYEEDMRIHGA